MKKILIALLIFGNLNALATSSKKSKKISKYKKSRSNKLTKKLKRKKKRRSKLRRKFSVGFGYGLSSKIKATVSDNGSVARLDNSDFNTKSLIASYTEKIDSSLYLNLGGTYKSLKVDDLTNDDLSYINTFVNIKTPASRRVKVYAGLSIGKWTEGKGVEDLDSGIGYQFGTSIRMTKSLEIDVQHYTVTNKGIIESIDVETELSALQIGTNFRF